MEQSYFRIAHCTTTTVLNVTDNIIGALDTKLAVLLVVLDCSKAFGLTDYNMLISELQYYVVDSTTITVFKSYVMALVQNLILFYLDYQDFLSIPYYLYCSRRIYSYREWGSGLRSGYQLIHYFKTNLYFDASQSKIID